MLCESYLNLEMAFDVNTLSPHGHKMAAMVPGVTVTFKAVPVSSPPMRVPCKWLQKLSQRCPPRVFQSCLWDWVT